MVKSTSSKHAERTYSMMLLHKGSLYVYADLFWLLFKIENLTVHFCILSILICLINLE